MKARMTWIAAGTLVVVAAATIVALLAFDDDSRASIDSGDPDIRGEITSISDGSGDILATVLIEGEMEPDTEYDKASVTIRSDTRVFRREAGELIDASFEDLAEGQRVEAWFTGPVAESYPVQAKAGQIVILGD